MRTRYKWVDSPGVGLAVVSLACLALLSGCEAVDEECLIDEEVGCSYPAVLRAPDWVAAGESISVYTGGVLGPDSCYHLERIEQEWRGDTCVLRPVAHHVAERCVTCGGTPAYFGEYVTLFRADSGWVRVEIEIDGPLLVDSTFVRALPAQVDTFTYTAYVGSSPAVAGWFTMRWPDSGAIRGEYHFGYADGFDDPNRAALVAGQIGDGTLAGFVDDDGIFLRLEPHCAEPASPCLQVELRGMLVGERYAGGWSCPFAWCHGGGFEAIRK